MSRQMNSGRKDGFASSGRGGSGSGARYSDGNNGGSDAKTKPGTTASKAAVRIEGYKGGSLNRSNVGPAGAPYYEEQ